MNDGHVATNTKVGKAARIQRKDTTRHTTPAANISHPTP